MSVASTKLQYAMKSLRRSWEETREQWTDKVRDDFEKKHLSPLQTQVDATMRSMDKLAELLAKMREDCS